MWRLLINGAALDLGPGYHQVSGDPAPFSGWAQGLALTEGPRDSRSRRQLSSEFFLQCPLSIGHLAIISIVAPTWVAIE